MINYVLGIIWAIILNAEMVSGNTSVAICMLSVFFISAHAIMLKVNLDSSK